MEIEDILIKNCIESYNKLVFEKYKIAFLNIDNTLTIDKWEDVPEYLLEGFLQIRYDNRYYVLYGSMYLFSFIIMEDYINRYFNGQYGI